jgi:hypothetical protein
MTCLLFKVQLFGDWILSTTSGGILESVSEIISVFWTQLSKLNLKTETESSLRNVFKIKDTTKIMCRFVIVMSVIYYLLVYYARLAVISHHYKFTTCLFTKSWCSSPLTQNVIIWLFSRKHSNSQTRPVSPRLFGLCFYDFFVRRIFKLKRMG